MLLASEYIAQLIKLKKKKFETSAVQNLLKSV
jgi:hypothetical protein